MMLWICISVRGHEKAKTTVGGFWLASLQAFDAMDLSTTAFAVNTPKFWGGEKEPQESLLSLDSLVCVWSYRALCPMKFGHHVNAARSMIFGGRSWLRIVLKQDGYHRKACEQKMLC